MDAADGPRGAHVSIGVTSIELVAVVQPQEVGQHFGGGRRPQEDLFGPIHPQVAVQMALCPKVAPSGVPQRIMGESQIELLERAGVLPGILGMGLQGAARPVREAPGAVAGGVLEAPVVCQLASHNELLEEGLDCLDGRPDRWTSRAARWALI